MLLELLDLLAFLDEFADDFIRCFLVAQAFSDVLKVLFADGFGEVAHLASFVLHKVRHCFQLSLLHQASLVLSQERLRVRLTIKIF